MSRAGRLIVAMACALLVNCSKPTENPLAAELTAEQEALLIELSIGQIEATENYTPDNFEQLQQKHFETMAEEMRDAALEYLQKRLDKIAILEMSQTVELDRESVEVESRKVAPEKAMAIVSLDGTRSYVTNNASKSAKTRFAVAWVITVDGGELDFHHRGIRMRELKD
jgi:hypothetical protein